MSTTTLTSKGQMTLPVEIRRSLGLKPGAVIALTLLPNGTVIIRAKRRRLIDLKGMVKPGRRRHVSLAELNR